MAVHPCTAQEALINQSFPSCRHERYGAGNHRWLSRIRAWVLPGVYVRTGAFGRVDPRPRSHRLRLWTAPGDRGVSWWGLLLGGTFGFLLGGPIGALLGAAAGRLVGSAVRNLEIADATETPVERVQMAFFAAVFGVMGHVAKADGRVSPEEIRLATQVMDQLGLDAEQRRLARDLFNAGKQPDFPLDGVLDQLRRECGRSLNLVRMFLEMQIQAAGADGTIHTPGPLPRVRAAPPGRATGPPPRRARRAPPALAAPRPVCAAPSVPPATSRPPGRCRRRQCPGRRLSPSRGLVIADVVCRPPFLAGVVAHRHAATAYAADGKSLQQRGPLARRSRTVLAVGPRMAEQLPLVGFEPFPGDVARVCVRQQHGPLSLRQVFDLLASAGKTPVPRASEREGARVARIVQHAQSPRGSQGLPVQTGLSRPLSSSCTAPTRATARVAPTRRATP